MAKAGRGGPALATAAIGSFVAGTLATLGIVFLAPWLVNIAVNFGPEDYFALMCVAFITVSATFGDSPVRGLTSLPNGTGKTVRVGVFARGPKAEEAQAAGADVVGAEDLAEKVQGGEIAFDRCIATPDMMGIVGRLGKILGPRGAGRCRGSSTSRPSRRISPWRSASPA